MSTKTNKKEILEKIAESPVKFIALGILTGGVYTLLHLYKNQDRYNSLTDKNQPTIPDWMFYISFATMFISGIIAIVMNFAFDDISKLLSFALFWDGSSNVSDLAMSCLLTSIKGVKTYNVLNILYSNIMYIDGILFTIIAFKIRKVLISYTKNDLNQDLKMNGFLTFLFNIFYVNHKINQIVSGNISGNQNSNNVPQDDITSQLEKLNDLKEKGILSQDEFDNKKQELLAKM